MKNRLFGVYSLPLFLLAPILVWSEIIVDQSIPKFQSNVLMELELMRSGKRGIVCQTLVHRLDAAPAHTTISPITDDEKTWHPNDRKGTRSHVVPLDTKVRGAARRTPTSVVLYLHPSRVEPSLSLFRVGTFAHELAMAMDINRGEFSGSHQIVEKRATFFRNAWKDSIRSELISVADRIPTEEYQMAKQAGFISKEYAEFFPILDITTLPNPLGIKNQSEPIGESSVDPSPTPT